jgi:hypothetical protein
MKPIYYSIPENFTPANRFLRAVLEGKGRDDIFLTPDLSTLATGEPAGGRMIR